MGLAERFWSKVRMGSDCWEWRGARDRNGYGRILVAGKVSSRAHRVSWGLANGPIRTGLHVLHRCDRPTCVRPDHLFLGSHVDNMADMTAKGRSRGPTGRGNANAKLSESAVLEIFRRRANGERVVDIAASFGVRANTISMVLTGKNWKHVRGGVP